MAETVIVQTVKIEIGENEVKEVITTRNVMALVIADVALEVVQVDDMAIFILVRIMEDL